MDASSIDGIVHMTSPVPSPGLRGASPFEVPDPEALVFVCFFRNREDRSRFAMRLRTVVGRAALRPNEAPSPEVCIGRYREAAAQGRSPDALLAAVEWWNTQSPEGVHIYNLTLEYPPFHASSLISFRELQKDAVRANAEHALDMMEQERSRVAGFFGWGTQPGIEP